MPKIIRHSILLVFLLIMPCIYAQQQEAVMLLTVETEQAATLKAAEARDVYHQWPCHGDSGALLVIMQVPPDAVAASRPYTFVWETPHGGIHEIYVNELGVFEGHFFDERGKRYNYLTRINNGYDSIYLIGATDGAYPNSAYSDSMFFESGTFHLSYPPPLLVDSAVIMSPSCDGINDGYIRPIPTGGNNFYPYFYWTSDSGSGIAQYQHLQDSLSPGLYHVTVTDYRGCTGSGSFSIPAAEPVIISHVNKVASSCISLNDGVIELSASGGREHYLYIWETIQGAGLEMFGNPQTTLSPGDYRVTVYGSSGNCEGESRTLHVGTRDVTAGTGRDTAICSNETLYLYDLIENNDPYGYFGSNIQSPLDASGPFSHFPQGTHTFFYRIDETPFCKGDTSYFQIYISTYKEAGTGSSTFMCERTAVFLFDYLLGADPGGFWLDSKGTTIPSGQVPANQLEPGSNRYVYHIEGDHLCPASQATVQVRLDSIAPLITCPDDQYIRINTLSEEYEIDTDALDPHVIDNCDYSQQNDVNGKSTLYGVTISDDTRITWTATDVAGNQASCSFTIRLDFFIPNLFTPDGDGYNDTWDFEVADSHADAIVSVSDRWGRTVYTSAPGYPVKWDGQNMSGNPVPNGNYYYNIRSGNTVLARGYVTVLR